MSFLSREETAVAGQLHSATLLWSAHPGGTTVPKFLPREERRGLRAKVVPTVYRMFLTDEETVVGGQLHFTRDLTLSRELTMGNISLPLLSPE